MIVALGAWRRRFLPATEALGIRAELMERGGGELVERFMAELRAEHLRGEAVSTVREELRAAYEKARAKRRRRSFSATAESRLRCFASGMSRRATRLVAGTRRDLGRVVGVVLLGGEQLGHADTTTTTAAATERDDVAVVGGDAAAVAG